MFGDTPSNIAPVGGQQGLKLRCPKMGTARCDLDSPPHTGRLEPTEPPLKSMGSRHRIHFHVSGKKKEPKPKLLGPDILRWGGGLPREGVGAEKFGTSLETRETKLFWRDIPGFCRDIQEMPEKFEKKKFVFNFRSLIYSVEVNDLRWAKSRQSYRRIASESYRRDSKIASVHWLSYLPPQKLVLADPAFVALHCDSNRSIGVRWCRIRFTWNCGMG